MTMIALAVALAAVLAGTAPPGTEPVYRPDDDRNHEARWEGFSLFVDQDVFFEPASDQDYTMGVEFVCQGRWVKDRKLTWPLEKLDRLFWLGRRHETLQTDRVLTIEHPSRSTDKLGFASHTIHFGNTAFTPAKATLGLTEPIHDDRPYASLLYLKVRRTSARGDAALVSDLTVGVLGLRISEWVQTQIHEANGDVLPGGWPNQISDGGEPSLKYRVSPRWRVLDLVRRADSAGGGALPVGADLAAAVDLSAGYYTNASAGGRLRLGLIRSAWWSFERNAIADVRAPQTFRSVFGGGRPFVQELYAWASGGGTAWLYNAFLQGQFRESAVTLSFDDESIAPIKRFTADAQVGVTLRVKPGISATYAVQWLSPTFGGAKERTHSWGSFYVGFQK